MKAFTNVLACGVSVAPLEWKTNNVPTPYRLYYVIDGEAFFKLDNVEFELLKNHFYLFPSSLPFLIRQNPENRLNHLYYNFVLSPPIFSNAPICVSVDGHPSFSHFLEIMKASVENYTRLITPDAKDVVTSVLESFLSLLFTIKPVVSPTDSFILKSIEYIEKHYCDNITIKEIASALYLSEDYFIRRFKKEMGMTPHVYLSRLRVSVARELISGGETLKNAAELTGYQNSSSLCHAIKKYQ